MGQIGWRIGMLVVVALALGGAQDGLYAAEEITEDDSPWSNDTDLSIVVTEGNSITSTVGFNNTLRRDGKKSWFAMKLDSLRSETADDRFVILAPGVEWVPGAVPPPSATRTIEPDLEPDIERYFIEGKYGRQISNTREWNLGGSWERNEDAGILNRYIAFAGLGNAWKKEEGLEFNTAYGLSYTEREEEEPDREKDDSFAGIRLSLRFLKGIGQATVFENDFTSNMSLKDTSDYSLDMTNALRVTLSDHFSLKVSLQWLFESEPALEEVDLKAFVELLDPDGVPGSGDEFFRTVSSGGIEVELGDADIRKEQLDTIFRTSLVIHF